LQKPIEIGDKICASISAAFDLCQVYQRAKMGKLHESGPEYNFVKHKGYGTKGET